MVDLNEVHLTGRLVRDVELRRNSNGSPFVWFPLAVNGMKGKDGNTISDFIDSLNSQDVFSVSFIDEVENESN